MFDVSPSISNPTPMHVQPVAHVSRQKHVHQHAAVPRRHAVVGAVVSSTQAEKEPHLPLAPKLGGQSIAQDDDLVHERSEASAIPERGPRLQKSCKPTSDVVARHLHQEPRPEYGEQAFN